MARRVSFDLLAPFYDAMEWVTAGRLLQRARLTWLESLEGRRHVLIAGVGHGRFAGAAASRFLDVALTCVDASACMLAVARRRVSRENPRVRAEWIEATLPAWRPASGRFDAIVTCFFLDCFAPGELAQVIDALAAGASEDALWVHVDFALPEAGWRRARARVIHGLMYSFFRCVAGIQARRLTPPDTMLQAAGFVMLERRDLDWGLLRAELWQRRSGASVERVM